MDKFLKILGFGGDAVSSERQKRKAINTAFVGRDGSGCAGFNVRNGDEGIKYSRVIPV